MAEKHGSAWCPRCADQVLTVGSAPAHLVHGLVAVLGLLFYWPLGVAWLLVWLLASAAKRPQRCTKCGGDVEALAHEANRIARRKAKEAAKAAKANAAPPPSA